jgi:hypothetical protein
VGSNCTAAGFVDTIFCIDDNRGACRQEVENFSSNVDKGVDKQEEAALALLLNLSDNDQNQSQINTVFSTQEKVDRVDGFEPTASNFPRNA